MIILKRRRADVCTKPAPKLTVERLREVLDYDPETGVFMWLVKVSRKVVVGNVAGSLKPDGYRYIGVDGERHEEHRLAHLYMTGQWPAHEIDHKDRDRANNRWSNLRNATRAQNHANSRLRSGKATLKGVKAMPYGRFHARIVHDGREQHLGTFATEVEAHAAYVVAAEQLHGEFARAG